MAKVLISLLGILLLLNAMTFLLVAFQDPAGGEVTAEGEATDPAITQLSTQINSLIGKVDALSTRVSNVSRQLGQLDRLTQQTARLSQKLDGVVLATRGASSTRDDVGDEEVGEELEEEPLEEEPREED